MEIKNSIKRVICDKNGIEYILCINKVYDIISMRKSISIIINKPDFGEFICKYGVYYYGVKFGGITNIQFSITKKEL